MSLFAKQARDLAHAYHVGRSFFRHAEQATKNAGVPEQACSWHEGKEGTAIGYEASWAGIFPQPMK